MIRTTINNNLHDDGRFTNAGDQPLINYLHIITTLHAQGRVPLETAEQRVSEEEVVEKTTTHMYRAPEMVDLYMERELTEKVDVWVRQAFSGRGRTGNIVL